MNIREEVSHLVAATRYSFGGIRFALKETAFKQEIFFGIIHYTLIFLIDETLSVKLVLASLWPIVMSAELINSAVEQMVDHMSPEWNEFAKHAKDMCSAAVGILIVLTVCVWITVGFIHCAKL